MKYQFLFLSFLIVLLPACGPDPAPVESTAADSASGPVVAQPFTAEQELVALARGILSAPAGGQPQLEPDCLSP